MLFRLRSWENLLATRGGSCRQQATDGKGKVVLSKRMTRLLFGFRSQWFAWDRLSARFIRNHTCWATNSWWWSSVFFLRYNLLGLRGHYCDWHIKILGLFLSLIPSSFGCGFTVRRRRSRKGRHRFRPCWYRRFFTRSTNGSRTFNGFLYLLIFIKLHNFL